MKVVLNTKDMGEHIFEVNGGGNVYMRARELRAMGLKNIGASGTTTVSLRTLAPDLTYEVDERAVTLRINASPRLFGKVPVENPRYRKKELPYRDINSAFLNYSLRYNKYDQLGVDSSTTYGASIEAGARVSGFLGLSTFNHTRTEETASTVRLMTRVIRDDRERLLRYTLGDFSAHTGLLGGRGVFGGLSLEKFYALDPYKLRYQTIGMSKILETPSNVRIYRNGVLISEGQYDPGEYEFMDLVAGSGHGELTMIATDAFGREDRVSTPFYLSTMLISPGLHEYSYNVGYTRVGLGTEESSYEDPAALFYHRAGITRRLTLGLRGEADDEITNLGATATWLPLRIGEITAAVAGSSAEESGNATYLGFSYNDGINFSLSTTNRSLYYTNLSLRRRPDTTKSVNQAGIMFVMGPLGSISFNYLSREYYGGYESLQYGARYGIRLIRGAHLSLSATRFDNGGTIEDRVYAQLSVLLPGFHFASLSRETIDDRVISTASLRKSPGGIKGLGYSLRVRQQEETETVTDSHADISYKGNHGEYRANYNESDVSKSTGAEVRGAVVYADGTVKQGRPVTDSFSIVRVAGIKGVRVMKGGSEAALTDGNGEALVSEMLSYRENRVSIKQDDIPLNFSMDDDRKSIMQPYRSGSILDFKVTRTSAIMGNIYFVRGGVKKPAEIASLVLQSGSIQVETIVGKGGEYYVENLPPGVYKVQVRLKDEACEFNLTVPESKNPFLNLGDTTCQFR